MHMLHMYISIMFIMAVAFAFTMRSPFPGVWLIIAQTISLVKHLSNSSGFLLREICCGFDNHML